MQVRSGVNTSATKGPLSPRTILYGTDADAAIILQQHDAYARETNVDAFDWTSGLPVDCIPWMYSQHLRVLLMSDLLVTQSLTRGDNPVAVAEVRVASLWSCGVCARRQEPCPPCR